MCSEKWKITSIITICAGFVFLVIGGILWYKNVIGNISMGFIISVGMGLISVGFAFYSIHLSKTSEEYLTTISNANFMGIIDIFENERIQLLNNPERGLEVPIWKCKTYIDRAHYLHKKTKIEETNRHTLFQWFVYLIRDLNDSGIDFNKLEKRDLNNLLEMVKKLRDFDLSDEDLKQLNTIEKTVSDWGKHEQIT